MPEPNQPPEMPPFERGLNVPLFQIIGMVVIIGIPVLALLGLFGETRDTIEQSSDSLDVSITYPSTFRYKMIENVNITVENTSGQSLPTIRVLVDSAYIDQFSTVKFTPSVQTVTGDHYIVELQDIAPGEARVVTIEIQAENYGQHEGEVRLEGEGIDPVTLELSTTSLP